MFTLKNVSYLNFLDFEVCVCVVCSGTLVMGHNLKTKYVYISCIEGDLEQYF